MSLCLSGTAMSAVRCSKTFLFSNEMASSVDGFVVSPSWNGRGFIFNFFKLLFSSGSKDTDTLFPFFFLVLS